jgi:very-short-patch-repair endonuclease
MPKSLTPLARTLRRNATRAERRLWQGLRREQVAGFRFRRQVILGRFIADFACLEARMIVEVDGATHSTDEEIARDAARSAALAARDWTFCASPIRMCTAIWTACSRLMELRPRIDESAI